MQNATLPIAAGPEFIAEQAQLVCQAIANRLGTALNANIVDRVATAAVAVYHTGGDGRAIYETIRHDAELLLSQHLDAHATASRIIDKLAANMDNGLLLSRQAI